MAQRIGHDLVLELQRWRATLAVDGDGALRAAEMHGDGASLRVDRALGGGRPLTERERAEIHRNIDDRVLRGLPVAYRAADAQRDGDTLHLRGALTMAGVTRSAAMELHVAPGARITGHVRLSQREWGIEPYRAFMGALKVHDVVDVVLDVRLPEEGRRADA